MIVKRSAIGQLEDIESWLCGTIMGKMMDIVSA